MKVCEKCKLTYDLGDRCVSCGRKLSTPKKTDAYLKKILEIDDKILKRFKEIQNATIKEAKLSSKPKNKVKVLGISGSARDEFDMAAENSNSEFLLIECLKELKNLAPKRN
jgi:hypothetical protein